MNIKVQVSNGYRKRLSYELKTIAPFTLSKKNSRAKLFLKPINIISNLFIYFCFSGSYRECFTTSIILGHPNQPLKPKPRLHFLWLEMFSNFSYNGILSC